MELQSYLSSFFYKITMFTKNLLITAIIGSISCMVNAKMQTADSSSKLLTKLQYDFVNSSPVLKPINKFNKRYMYVGMDSYFNVNGLAYGPYSGIDIFENWSFGAHLYHFSHSSNNFIHRENTLSLSSIFYPNWEATWNSIITEPYFKISLNWHKQLTIIPTNQAQQYTLKQDNKIDLGYKIGFLWYMPHINNWRLRTELSMNPASLHGKNTLYLGIEYLTGYSVQGNISPNGFDRRYNFITDHSFVLYFPHGEYKLQSEHLSIINKVVTYLNHDNSLRLMIAGHAAGASTENYVSFTGDIQQSTDKKIKSRVEEIELSQRRAESAFAYLLKKQIAQEKLLTVWHGSKSLTDADAQEKFSHNSRVVLTLFRSLKN